MSLIVGQVKGLLVDLDGTLVDSTEVYLKSAKEAFKLLKISSVNKNVALEIARKLEMGIPIKTILHEVIPKSVRACGVASKIDNNVAREFWLEYTKTYDRYSTRAQLICGVYDALNILNKRFQMTLVTCRYSRRKKIEQQLQHLGLIHFFKAIITRSDTEKTKPEPDPFLESSQILKIPIEKCAVIGDSVIDVRAGKKAGARTIAVLSGLFDESTLKVENPDMIIESIAKLPSLLSPKTN